MAKKPFKNLLHTAVIAALPLSTQLACTPSTAPINPEPVTPAAKKNSFQDTIERIYPTNKAPKTTEECLKLCKQAAEQRYQFVARFSPNHPPIHILDIQSCTVGERKTMPLPIDISKPKPSTPPQYQQLSCQVTYEGTRPPRPIIRPVDGRLTQGTHISQPSDQDNSHLLGRYFSDMAAMETAAITAFRYLARELMAYDAPQGLIKQAQQAAQEEVEHAQMAGLLSSAYDAKPTNVSVEDFQLRSLYEIALENAVEGCVNETFAAACGYWQSLNATIEPFRDAMARIADDEIGHAELSHAIHAWAMPQLTQTQQQHIIEAQQAAISALQQRFKTENHPFMIKTVGLPNKEQAAQLLDQLTVSVWTDAIKSDSKTL